MRRALWLALFCIVIPQPNLAEELEQWIKEKIKSDEALLQLAKERTDGHSVELLKSSTNYVPFFLELPSQRSATSIAENQSLNELFQQERNSFLPGGYLFRIRFDNAPPLYALSSGEWSGEKWYSVESDAELRVNSSKIWAGNVNDNFSYASLIPGVPPRLIFYNSAGESIKTRSFDISSPDLETQINEAIVQFTENAEPVREMVTLAEFIRKDLPSWRPLKLTSQFNLRNQQERPEEIVQGDKAQNLNRQDVIGELSSKFIAKPNKNVSPPPLIEPQASRGKKSKNGAGIITLKQKDKTSESAKWPFILVGIALISILVIVLRAAKRKGKRRGQGSQKPSSP